MTAHLANRGTNPAVRLCGELPPHLASLAATDAKYARGEWAAALDDYLRLQASLVGDEAAVSAAPVECRIAWCHYYLGQFDAAVSVVRRATGHSPGDWHLSYLIARLARAHRKPDLALALLARLVQHYPNEALIRRDLAYAVYTGFSDIPGGRALWRPLLERPEYAASVGRYQLYSNFYQPDPADSDNRQNIRDYVARFIQPASRIATPAPPAARKKSSRRPRIGLISVFFHRSPVYALTIGALRAWCAGVDLVFIDRGKLSEDTATHDYRAIAAEWHPLRGLSAEVLEKRLRALKLDALIDMSGWSDTIGLRALVHKPAPRLFKWVGGQAASTGLAAFDGFIGDQFQSPHHLQSLYAEPLINLPGGYATYSAPAYLPAAQATARTARNGSPVVGVISNPIKLSTGFLAQLQAAASALDAGAPPVELRFIGNRYRHRIVQERIRAQLQPGADGPLHIEFLSPPGHENYLRAVAELDWVVDTWPYTGGLTILEALAIGVPCRTRAGRLFCQRHGYSHARYAGLTDAEIDLDRLGPFGRATSAIRAARQSAGTSLLPADSPRRDHARLARALDALVAGHIPS